MAHSDPAPPKVTVRLLTHVEIRSALNSIKKALRGKGHGSTHAVYCTALRGPAAVLFDVQQSIQAVGHLLKRKSIAADKKASWAGLFSGADILSDAQWQPPPFVLRASPSSGRRHPLPHTQPTQNPPLPRSTSYTTSGTRACDCAWPCSCVLTAANRTARRDSPTATLLRL